MTRDYVSRRAIDNAMPREDRIEIAGTVIQIDRESAKSVLKMLNVFQNAKGEYVAEIRERPLETTAVLRGPVVHDELRPEIREEAERRPVCDICRMPDKARALAVDHNHETGALRGFLCGPCNRGLGHYRDNPHLMRSAAEYLENPPGVTLRRYEMKRLHFRA